MRSARRKAFRMGGPKECDGRLVSGIGRRCPSDWWDGIQCWAGEGRGDGQVVIPVRQDLAYEIGQRREKRRRAGVGVPAELKPPALRQRDSDNPRVVIGAM